MNIICIKSFYKLYPSNIILENFNSSAASSSWSASELLLAQAVSSTENHKYDDGAIRLYLEAVVYTHRKTYKISQIRLIFTSQVLKLQKDSENSKMKLTIFFTIFVLAATIDASRPSKSEICTFQNCSSCDIVLKNTHNKKFGKFIPQCRNMMQSQGCCQKFMLCEVLGECVPRFLQYYH